MVDVPLNKFKTKAYLPLDHFDKLDEEDKKKRAQELGFESPENIPQDAASQTFANIRPTTKVDVIGNIQDAMNVDVPRVIIRGKDTALANFPTKAMSDEDRKAAAALLQDIIQAERKVKDNEDWEYDKSPVKRDAMVAEKISKQLGIDATGGYYDYDNHFVIPGKTTAVIGEEGFAQLAEQRAMEQRQREMAEQAEQARIAKTAPGFIADARERIYLANIKKMKDEEEQTRERQAQFFQDIARNKDLQAAAGIGVTHQAAARARRQMAAEERERTRDEQKYETDINAIAATKDYRRGVQATKKYEADQKVAAEGLKAQAELSKAQIAASTELTTKRMEVQADIQKHKGTIIAEAQRQQKELDAKKLEKVEDRAHELIKIDKEHTNQMTEDDKKREGEMAKQILVNAGLLAQAQIKAGSIDMSAGSALYLASLAGKDPNAAKEMTQIILGSIGGGADAKQTQKTINQALGQ